MAFYEKPLKLFGAISTLFHHIAVEFKIRMPCLLSTVCVTFFFFVYKRGSLKEKYAVYDYMQLRRIAVTFLNIRLMYK